MEIQQNIQFDEQITLTDYETARNKPMPSLNHSIVQANLVTELNVRFRKKYSVASELNLDLSDWPSVPDLCFYPKRKLDFKNDIIKMQEPPLGVVEIISPSQSFDKLTEKAREYFDHGVKSCWLVLLSTTTICVFSSPDDFEYFKANQTLRDEILDITLPLNEVFE